MIAFDLFSAVLDLLGICLPVLVPLVLAPASYGVICSLKCIFSLSS